MVEHNRIPIPGSEKQPVANAKQIGDVHPDERIEVTIGSSPEPTRVSPTT